MCEKACKQYSSASTNHAKLDACFQPNWISPKHDFQIEQFGFQVLLFVNSDVSRFILVIIREHFDGSIER